MKIKKFIGETMQDTLTLVKKEMGPEAVILHSRKFRKGGFWGFFSKNFVEVTAAIDTSQKESVEVKRGSIDLTVQEEVPSGSQIFKELYRKPYQKTEDKESSHIQNTIINKTKLKETEDFDLIKRELIEVKSLVSKLSSKIPESIPKAVSSNEIIIDPFHRDIYNRLTSQEVLPELALSLIEKAAKGKNGSFIDSLTYELEKIISLPSPITLENKPVVAALVGPTGVGKTTTIAKIAAHYSLNLGKQVAFITADTYRIAAIEQLKTYGDILNAPIKVIYNPSQLDKALDKFPNHDLILIDTAGRSHKNKMQMLELKAYMDQTKALLEVYLVLSATTKYADLLEITKNYDVTGNSKLIFTKLDETSTYGTILNILNKCKKPLAYFTHGQAVPEDFEVGSPRRLINLLLGEILNERPSRESAQTG
jgi:flagellar biosynthesis protein FlhF